MLNTLMMVMTMKWNNVNDVLPKDRVFVLVKCPSGYSTIPEVITTARLDLSYRDSWIDWSNDRLTERGLVPTHWCDFPD